MTIPETISNAATLDGTEIAVCGYLICEREHCALYDRSDSARSCGGLWIGNSGYSERVMKSLNRSMVRVVGVFRSRKQSGAGHFGRWPAELTQVTSIEADATPDSPPQAPRG